MLKKTNKNCQYCTKTFSFDSNSVPTRKFCSKQCYLNSLKKKKVKEVTEIPVLVLENKKVDGLIDRFFKLLKGK